MTNPRTRLYVTDTLAAGQSISLSQDQVHYLRNVLRMEQGVEVGLFNGRDGEWLARIGELGKERGTVIPDHQIRDQRPCPDVWILFAPIKRDAIDLVAEKSSELGVAVIWPVLTRHTDVARVNIDRMRANAIEAAEQSERLSIPAVRDPIDLPRLLSMWPEDRAMIVCAESGEAESIASVIQKLPDGPVAILVGPEGGFARSELDMLLAQPYVHAARLGPRILRAETASLAALTCWQAIKGDWK